MSACEGVLPQEEIPRKPSIYKPYVILITPDAPNLVQSPVLPPETVAINHALLSVQESLERRVKLRFDVECKVKWRGSITYKRLRGASVLLNAPNADQAELFIQAIHNFAASLNGKWLAAKPENT